MNYVLRKVSYDDKDEIIEYINELYEYASLINGVGRLQDYVNSEKNDFDMWYKKLKRKKMKNLIRFVMFCADMILKRYMVW